MCIFECWAARARPVMMHQHVDDFFEQVGLLWAEEASSDLVNGSLQLRQLVVVILSVVPKQDER